MKKLKARLREKLIRWLGIDEAVEQAKAAEHYARSVHKEIMDAQRVMIDLGARQGDTTIVVASQLNNGRVFVMHDNFGNLRELEGFMDSRFPGWRRDKGRNDHRRVFDTPYNSRQMFEW